MNKRELTENVLKNWATAKAGLVAAIVRAAQDPSDEALANIEWYERRVDALGILSLKVEAHVEEDL